MCDHDCPDGCYEPESDVETTGEILFPLAAEAWDQ